jgi:hypothetical protein
MARWLLPVYAAAAVALCLAAACGKGANTAGGSRPTVDGDPMALLPGAAIFAGNVDARALFADETVASQLASLSDRLVPLGDDAGFRASRDVDRVVFAAYATTGSDVAAILRGRFDVAKITAATHAKNGAPIVRGTYAEQATYTVGGIAYAVLTPSTVVAGTGDGLRRVLERVHAGTFDRALPPWVNETLETNGADVAAVADFATQPVASAAIGSLKLPWLQGLRTARVLAGFPKPGAGGTSPPPPAHGLTVAATLGYGVPQQADAAAHGVRFVDGWLKLIGPLLGGIRLQNLEVTTEQSDLRCKFAVDDQALGSLLALVPRLLPAP